MTSFGWILLGSVATATPTGALVFLASSNIGASGAATSPQTPVPLSVIADPPRDPKHPTRNVHVLVPSGGVGMNGLFLVAAGEGPRPTLLLLHGLPGSERNFDLAQAARRAGWNVLTFAYRGAWGSAGSFSIAGALDDVAAAMAFLRSPAVVAEHGIDTDRIVIAGHSMGGFAAAHYATRDPNLAGLILIDAADLGAMGKLLAAGGEGGRNWFAALQGGVSALRGTTAEALRAEFIERAPEWSLPSLSKQLSGAGIPILTIYTKIPFFAEPNRALADELRSEGPVAVRAVEMATDHVFSDRRIALAAEVVRWLEAMHKR